MSNLKKYDGKYTMRAVAYIRKHLNRDKTIVEVAEYLGWSKWSVYYLSEKLRKKGMDIPHRWQKHNLDKLINLLQLKKPELFTKAEVSHGTKKVPIR